MLGDRFTLLRLLAYIDIDGAVADIRCFCPYRVENLVAGKHSSWVPREIVQKAEFGRSGGYDLTPHRQGHGIGIDFQFARFDASRRKRRLTTAQHRLDASH